MRQVSTTSADLGYGQVTRRAESDADSAICIGVENGEIEKQLSPKFLSPEPEESESWAPTGRFSHFKRNTKDVVLFLVPSFFRRRPRVRPTVAKKHQGVTTLNGLRGLASLFVFNEHFTRCFDQSFLISYGGNGKTTILQWPFVRVFWSGFTMVAIFFVISGYVLSYRALQYIHNGNTACAHGALASTAVRRAFRLYIPTFVAVMLCGVLSWAGAFDRSRVVSDTRMYDIPEAPPLRFDNLLDQMRSAWKHCVRLTDVWYTPDGNLYAGDYDLHTWTIPIEFRNSMILLLCLLTFSRLRTRFRITAQILTIVFTIHTQNKNMLLFFIGMLIADIDLIRKSRYRYLSFNGSNQTSRSILFKLTSPHSIIYPFFFLIGLFICSIPAYGYDQDPIYKHLYHLIIPAGYQHTAEWFRVPGATLIVWSVANSQYLAPIFSNRLSQYLGKIAFALYLVHGNILKIILHAALPTIYGITGDGTKAGQTTVKICQSWFLALALILPLTIWVADVFWRAVDVPAVKFAKWIEEMTSEDDEDASCTSPKRW